MMFKRLFGVLVVVVMATWFVGCSGEEVSVGEPEVGESAYDVEISQMLDKGWELVFSDEFDGEILDENVWSYQEGTGAQFGLEDWGNGEAQYYQDDNVYVEDGFLVIEAKREDVENKAFTSGRITTKDQFAKAYGRIEGSMSFPKGDGLWPAFWMLPQEEVYGTWAASGEIDIVEVRGRFSKNVNGALHYGGIWPNNEYSSAFYVLEDSIEEFHTYAVEWEPGEIRWYVDEELFFTETKWYSVSDGQVENNEYPAPFDQDFYILLNMAVGGIFDEYRLPDEEFLSAKMKVDYIRVYELVGREYKEAVKPVEEVGELSADAKVAVDGNYVYDVAFEDEITYVTSSGAGLHESLWNVVAISDFGGAVEYEVTDDGLMLLDIQNKGNQNYSVQLIQHVPIAKNRTYDLTFVAKADEARDIKIKIGGGESRGWTMYAPDTTISLTEELQEFTVTFKMKDDTDENARLEFNCGLSDVNVYIGDVGFMEVD